MSEAAARYQPLTGRAPHPHLWLGTWALGGEGFGAVTADTAQSVIDRAIDAGIHHFDTAGFYAHGKSEVLLGKAIRHCRKEMFVASKGGLMWEGREVRHDASPDGLRAELHRSLTRLNTDYLDLFQLHWPDHAVPVSESLEALQLFQREGLIRHWGVCNLNVQEVTENLSTGCCIPHQVHHNLIHRNEAVLAAGAADNRACNCAYSPLEQGLLANRRDGVSGLGKRDVRRRNPHFSNHESMERARLFSQQCEANGSDSAEAACRWVLSQPHVDVLIVGPKRPEHVSILHGLR
jgi:aryl-alcohol dehydrogenase-like predicted oxidoreductase